MNSVTGCIALKLVVLAGAALFCAAVPCAADDTAVTGFNETSYAGHGNFDDGGYKFTASDNLVVDTLGLFTHSATLAESHQISIYDLTGNMLTSVTVDAGSAPDGTGFVYKNLASPLSLSAGDYIIGAYYNRSSSDHFVDNGNSVATGPSVTFDEAFIWFNPNVGFNPSSPAGQFVFQSGNNIRAAFIGPNFLYNVQAPAGTPEPGAIGLAGGLGLAFSVLARRRGRPQIR
jgi:hypothetical protein